MSRAIVIFARSPRAEALAKRLDDSAVHLFEAVTREWLEVARRVNAEVLVACDPSHRADFARLGCFRWIDQGSGTFGARLHDAGAAAFQQGFATIAVTGIDAPPLRARELELAFLAVETGEAPAAIAPARDGGLNLILIQGANVQILSTFVPAARDLTSRCRDWFGDALRLLTPAVDIDAPDSMSLMWRDAAWRPFRGLLTSRLLAVTTISRYAGCSRTSLSLRAPPRS